jgi:peptidoglycan/LPS O-acetylase OafA/YrhL
VLIGASFGLGGVRLVLGNRVTAFLAAISYQFYMWHQVVALQMKKWRFPPSQSETPHVAGERAWQVSYLILALVISLIISTLIAYLAELPLARRLSPKTTGKRKGGRPI